MGEEKKELTCECEDTINKQPEEPQQEKCPFCSGEIAQNTVFCPTCGKKVGKTEQEKQMEQASKEREERKKAKIKKCLKIGVPMGSALILLVVLYIFRLPIAYWVGGLGMSSENYSLANACYVFAGEYKDSEKQATLSEKGKCYKEGIKFFDKKEYVNAYNSFSKAGSHADAKKKKEESAYNAGLTFMEAKAYEDAVKYFKYALRYDGTDVKLLEIAKIYIDQREYEKAADSLDGVNDSESGGYRAYALGMDYYREEKYDKAAEQLKLASEHGLYDASDVLPEAYYLNAKELFSDEKYSDAKNAYKEAGDYKDSASMVYACDLMRAEDLFREGRLNAAKEIYQTLPTDFSYDDVYVASRMQQFEAYSLYVGMCGKWGVTDSYMETRDTSRYGDWTNWYREDYYSSNNDMEIFCIINKDGSVTIKGNFKMDRFTEYSSIQRYLEETTDYISFSKNISDAPKNMEIRTNYNLSYTNGIFTASYYMSDKYSHYTTYSYTTRYTYGTRKESY